MDTRNYFRIEFVDNGIGFADHIKKVIVQRGHREQKESEGMGLDLSLISKILSNFNRKIWFNVIVKGDYTRGSKIILWLPEANKINEGSYRQGFELPDIV